MTQCHCDPEVVTVHLFTLATMVFVLQLIVNTITVKISVGFFWFPSNSKEFKKWEHLNRLNSLIDTNVIAIVNKKKLWTALCHLTNELVPLNGHIGAYRQYWVSWISVISCEQSAHIVKVSVKLGNISDGQILWFMLLICWADEHWEDSCLVSGRCCLSFPH